MKFQSSAGGTGIRAVPLFLTIVVCLGLGSIASASTLVCKSTRNQTKVCPANTAGGVTLVHQLSSASCYKNESWGYNRSRIWVSNGCKAEFRVGSDSHRVDYDDDDDDAAAIAGLAMLAIGAAAVAADHNDHHKNRSSNYQSYDYDSRHSSSRHYHDRYNRNELVNCESHSRDYNYCRASVRNHRVRLLRQHSNRSCRFGESWGYDYGGIWVDNGCKGTFEIER